MGSLPKPYGQYTASNFSSEFVELFGIKTFGVNS